jgi:hypothetical protein
MAELSTLSVAELSLLPDYLVPSDQRQDLSNYLAVLAERQAEDMMSNDDSILAGERIERKHSLARSIYRELCDGRVLPLPNWSWSASDGLSEANPACLTSPSFWSGSPVNTGAKEPLTDPNATTPSIDSLSSPTRSDSVSQENRVFKGPRGGKYTKAVSQRDGRPYRRYF